MKIKKKHLTLLEVIISLFLIGIILTFLFGFFAKIMKVEKNIEVKKEKIFETNHLHARLNYIFSNIYLGNFIDESPFYTKYDSNKNVILFINFDNKVDIDPNYSLDVRATLFIDDDKNLCLKLFSKGNENETREEIIFKNVNKLEYKFLANKDLKIEKYRLEKISENINWYKYWSKKAENVPSCVYIKINDSLDFAFFLPSHHVKM
ncbi:MAG: hypothetical protein KR126chlam6_00597 [Candidatus Anoxychlamydiales bacterium]|nr:hypothetical protein [Candidatus Anoxychlamydiales bacterium]